jgi:predicted  nucleic acid-binding Zn-ribbon protein
MRKLGLLIPVAAVSMLAACDPQASSKLKTLAHADSLRTDSLISIKNDLLNEVMSSTQFVNDLNSEISRLKAKQNVALATKLTSESDMAAIKEQRVAVMKRIQNIVARLDSSEARVAALRKRASGLATRDSTLVAQVAEYEKTIADLRHTVDQQRADYEATIAKQTAQIAGLNSKVDTMTTENTRLMGEAKTLTDTVTQLTTVVNTAYYVIGTKDDLVKQGVLVEEGHRRFLLFGGRSLSPARELDPAKFTRIDRSKDKVINFPEGDFVIFTRQNPAYASPFASKDGAISGGLRIDQPERFWEASKFLIIVKT